MAKVTVRQIGGDDGYQWCVLIDGRVKWNGMTRAEARWRADKERAKLREPDTRDMQQGKNYGHNYED